MKALIFGLVTLVATSAAAAQTAPGAGAQGDIKPWTYACRGEGATRICDAVHVLVDKTTQQEAIRIAVAKQVASGRTGVLVKVPLGFRLDSGAMLRLNQQANGNIDAIPFTRCFPDGCYAERPLTAAEVTALTNAKQVEMVVLALDGKPNLVEIDVTGLAANLKSMATAR